MNLLLSIPGDIGWFFSILAGILIIGSPILAFNYYLRTKNLQKQLDAVTKEKNELAANNMIV